MAQKILVVEDDPVFRNYLHQVLKYDFDVTTAPGPLDALEELRKDTYALLVTDLRMPDMDGRALVEKVREEIDPHIMVIVITAYEDDWPMDMAMQTEVFRYLRKGAFLPSELKQNVSKALEMHGSIVSLEEYKKRADISETLYKDMFDKSADAFFITDIHVRPVALNESFVGLSGYSIDDLRDRTLFDIVDDLDRHHVVQAFNSLVAGNPPGTIRLHFIRKDGTKKYAKVWVRLVRDVQGMTNALFCMARGIDGADEPKADAGVSVDELKNRLVEKESRIEAQEKKFQRLADHAKDIVVWLDKDFACEYVNREITRLLGYAPEELVGRQVPWSELVHPDDLPVVQSWMQGAKDKLMEVEGEFRAYAKSRFMLFFSYRIQLHYDASGAFSGLDIVAEDITQQKIAEQELRKANLKIQEFNERLTNGVSRKIKALRESEERYKQIVEDSTDIIFSLDTEARLVYMNKKGLQTLHVSLDDITMRPCREFIADEPSEKKLQDMIDAIARGSTPAPFDIAIETPEGRKVFRTNLVQIGDPSRVEYACIARDISEEIAKNKKLQLLATIEHYSADAIIGLDIERNIISWNTGASMMFGWSEDEATGMPAYRIIPDEFRNEAEEILQEVLEKGLVKDRETRRKTKDGQILDVLLTITALRDPAGKIFGFSLIIKDLTEKKKMESALIQSERLAATGKLSASIAHEINNPLYGIRSCLNHVLNTKADAIDYQFVKLAIKETDRIADLIRNMKTFYMPNEGKVQKIDLGETLRDVFILNRKYLEEHLVKLKFNPEGVFPVECVQDQIKQVFINIVANAVDAMPDGGELQVLMEENKDSGTVAVSFRDTGIGIASDDLPQIFDMFFSKKKPMVKGVGLGLSVSYGIINRHGGNIEVQSEEGKGSTFKITLPAKSTWARQLHLDLK
jgi:PAS domain S-box-containing protein